MSGNRRPSASALPNLPRGAQRPAVPPLIPNYVFPASEYSVKVTPPSRPGQGLHNHLDDQSSHISPTTTTARPRVRSMYDSRSNGVGYRDPGVETILFPEPTFYSSVSPGEIFQPSQRPPHHYSKSDLGGSGSAPNQDALLHHNPSVTSFASSYNAAYDDAQYESNEGSYEDDAGDLARGLSDSSLASEEGLRRFQAGELAENDEEWHRLVPAAARDALGKQEVQRQSVIFEVIKSEREYVADLEAVESVFVERLRTATPPIIKEPQLAAFISEVFGNLREILSYHQRLLAALFARQRDQHPLIQSVADIVLDTTLKSDFRSAYEIYIKHYPLSESHHRKQLKLNRAYEVFIQSASNDSRIRKRDLITFLSRPVTKLPRLNLLLEQVLKLTDPEYQHPDLETLPIILGILKDCIKSTQPGIEAAESKVKFWGLCESLVFQRGEIIDMDLYDESRTLVYTGLVLRRRPTETGFSEKWSELTASLLDNYFILTREEKRPKGSIKRLLMSRPIPLSFLRLGSFDLPPEIRREKADDGGLLESFRSQSIPIYPFTVYHAANKLIRRYTLYVASDALRKKWYDYLVDAIAVNKVRQESNMWFNPQHITDGFFRMPGKVVGSVPGLKITGKIHCAVPFVHGSKRFLVVGCGPGIYVAPVNTERYQLVLHSKNPISLAALTTLGDRVFNRLVVQVDNSIASYSLDILARLAVGQTHPQTLEASIERIGGNDANVIFFKHLHVGGKALIIYSSKRRLASSLTLQVLEAVSSSEVNLTPKRTGPSSSRGFRPYGDPGYVPKDAHDIIALSKMIGIVTSGGIVTADPTNIAQSSVAIVPDFQNTHNNEPMAALKARIEGLRPLGFVRVDANELLVVYDELGCYINKYGLPTRRCGYIKWEAKAVSYTSRNGHILLVSPEFIEVRSITTGRIVQVIEGQDIRLLYSGPYVSKEYPILVAMRGDKDDKEGVSDKIAELIETEEISSMTPTATPVSSMWDEWDM